MGVLKDIRGLLSSTKTRDDSKETRLRGEGNLNAEIARLQEQVRSYEELVEKQQGELRRLESEKSELAVKLKMLSTGKEQPISPESGAKGLSEEIDQLEARKNELSLILPQIDDLLQLKVKELSRRIIRFYQEAGQEGVAIDFRRAADGLEVAENFAYFLRELLKE